MKIAYATQTRNIPKTRPKAFHAIDKETRKKKIRFTREEVIADDLFD